MRNTRAAAPDLWILAPGVGFQGGNLRETLAAGLRASDFRGLIVPVSREISRAKSPREAAEALVAVMQTETALAATKAATAAAAASAAATAAAAAPVAIAVAGGEAVGEAETTATQEATPLREYQRQFIQVCLDMQVLRFGSFTLKSGRSSPYFFNAGLFSTGAAMTSLAQCYAQVILDSGVEYDVVFGPA